MRFGFELEVRSGARDALHLLHADGHASTDRFHSYHCRCGDCDYSDERYLFSAQQDCTADGEFITKILDYGSDRHRTAMHSLADALQEVNADTSGNVGNHVHVEKPSVNEYATAAAMARLFLRYQRDLEVIAAGPHDGIRAYNERLNDYNRNVYRLLPLTFQRQNRMPSIGGSYLYFGGRGSGRTYEFRLWNATKAAWRMQLHVGLSVAMMRAAIAHVDNGEHVKREDRRTLLEVLLPHMDDDTTAAFLRQSHYNGGMFQ